VFHFEEEVKTQFILWKESAGQDNVSLSTHSHSLSVSELMVTN